MLGRISKVFVLLEQDSTKNMLAIVMNNPGIQSGRLKKELSQQHQISHNKFYYLLKELTRTGLIGRKIEDNIESAHYREVYYFTTGLFNVCMLRPYLENQINTGSDFETDWLKNLVLRLRLEYQEKEKEEGKEKEKPENKIYEIRKQLRRVGVLE